MKKVFTLLTLLQTLAIFGQEEIPFSIRFQKYLTGDITFIANSIVNRNTGNNANIPYNKLHGSELNDQFEMQYIDIDNESTTFSSSSANFFVDNNSNEIIFAGLYWAANYKSEIGVSKSSGTSFENYERATTFNEIKIKTPQLSQYQDIKGQIIFDGYTNTKYKNIAPYVCFYDITSLVKNNPSGTYTVANIKATQGFIDGGVSGGWTVYFVYKNNTAKPKYITLYDGFAHVYNKPISIQFANFLTPSSGAITSKIALSALEGDYSIDGDNVRLKNTKTSRYFPLFSKIRMASNFFNSSITIEDTILKDRNPCSLNTLGYDALLLTLNNKKNQIIDNNITESEIKISSLGDKVYLFSTAFSVDLDPDFFSEKQKETLAVVPKEAKEILSQGTAVDEKIYEKTNNKEFQISNNQQHARQDKDIRTITVATSLKHGYYIISNVFAITNNRIRYRSFLKEHKIESGYFHNPENQYQYVFLKYYTTKEEAIAAYASNLNNTFFDDYWILEIDK